MIDLLDNKTRKEIAAFIKDSSKFTSHCKLVFDLTEGDLIKQVKKAIETQIKREESKSKMKERIPSINIMNRIVQKTSPTYNNTVIRTTEDINKELLEIYEKDINASMLTFHKNFNRYKNAVVEIFEKDGFVDTRAWPSHLFLPYSREVVGNIKEEAIIKFMGKDGNLSVYYVYTDSQFIIMDQNGELINNMMPETGWVNELGFIPFVYRVNSENLLVPLPDYDMYAMTILVPLLGAEINFGQQYLSNPIIYGMNIEFEGEPSRNADTFLMLKSDQAGQIAGELNVLQPNMDLGEQWASIKTQLAMWFESRGIVVNIAKDNVDNSPSGVALMIKNIDTNQLVKEQEVILRSADEELCEKVAMFHNFMGRSERQFTEDFSTTVSYSEVGQIESESEKVDRLSRAVESRLMSKKRAIKELNPNMSDEEIDKEIEQIRIENSYAFVNDNNGDME